MKIRTRFILTFFASIALALITTDLTYRVVYSLEAVARYQATGPEAQRVVALVMTLVVPFLWVMLFMLLGAWWLGRTMKRPLAELTEAMEHLKRKDLSFQLTYDGRDELGDLSRGFQSMQRELAASLDREWREQEGRREMVAAIAHDLRTPLTVVQSHAEGLLAATPERRQERQERYLTAIASNARRASALLTDLLTLSVLERAELELQVRPQPVRTLLERWMGEYEALAGAQSLRLLWDLGPENGRAVAADESRLHQVIDNLVENAIRHTPAGGHVGIRLSWTAVEAEVEVWDTGPGFAASDLPHLFDRYVQGGGAVGAAGLGLYICRLLVTRQGGRIAAANRPDGGSQVTFSLPAA